MLTAAAVGWAFVLSGCATREGVEPLEGHWVGSLDVGDDLLFMRAKFSRTETGLAGTLDLLGIGRLALAKSSFFASEVFFAMKRGDEAYAFTANAQNGSMVGELHSNGNRERGNFRLRRVADVDQRLIRSYVGTYRVGSDWIRAIEDCLDPWGTRQLVFVDPKNSGRKALFATSENTFFFGPGFLIPEPVEGRVTFLKARDGRPYLLWDQEGSDVMMGERIQSSVAAQRDPSGSRALERRCNPASG
jgi:hypothetical protein